MNVKTLTLGIVLGVIITGIAAYANSGPATWNTSPTSETMVIDKDSPIEVTSEHLIFDMPYVPITEYLIRLNTTATYRMNNPTSDTQSVQMAFPFVGQMNQIGKDDIEILVNNQVASYKIYAGEPVHSDYSSYDTGDYYEFDFEKVVGNITNEHYSTDFLNSKTLGTLYTITSNSTSQSMKMIIRVKSTSEATMAIGAGPTQAYSDKDTLVFEGLCTPDRPAEIFVFGDRAILEIEAYKTHEMKELVGGSDYSIQEEETTYRDFFERILDPKALSSFSYLENTMGKTGAFSFIDRYNLLTKLFAKDLVNPTKRAITATKTNEYLDRFSQDRYLTLVYEVIFEPQEEKEISVSYSTLASYNTKNSVNVEYGFDYLLSPAKYWKSFKDLTIEINADKGLEKMTSSTLPFEEKAPGQYYAHFDQLPEKELSVTFQGPEIKGNQVKETTRVKDANKVDGEIIPPDINSTREEKGRQSSTWIVTLAALAVSGGIARWLLKRRKQTK